MSLSTLLIEAVKRYNERGRYYHTLQHVGEMLTQLARCSSAANGPSLHKIVAVIGHDLVYVPGDQLNELRSADLTVDLISSEPSLSPWLNWIHAAIRATHDHRDTNNYDTNELLDLDLEPLGRSSRQYLEAGINIWREFKDIGVTLDDYLTGRTAWLQHMLDREVIFHTPMYNDIVKQQARDNMTRELKMIESGIRRLQLEMEDNSLGLYT